jgi:hypothetical protein
MMATEVRFWRSETCGFRSADHPIRFDAQITDEDVRTRNLILWGNDKTNSVIARINAKLPVRLDGHKVIAGDRVYDYDDVALAMVYPNPLNPERYVLIHSGNTWMAQSDVWIRQMSDDQAKETINYFRIGGGYPTLPDYFIFRQNRVGLTHFYNPSYRKLNVSVLEGGFFDAHWRLDRQADFFHWSNPMPQQNAALKTLRVVRPAPPREPIDADVEKVAPPKMTATPGTLALGEAQDVDGLRYHFSAAHLGRYFYRDFGSVFTSPKKVVALEVIVTNLDKGNAFAYPPLKIEDMSKLDVNGKPVAPYPVTSEQGFPALDPGESFRMVFLYDVEPGKDDALKLAGVGLKGDLALTLKGSQLKPADYNPNRYVEGARW